MSALGVLGGRMMKVFEWPVEPCHWLWNLWELAKRTREAVVQWVCALLN